MSSWATRPVGMEAPGHDYRGGEMEALLDQIDWLSDDWIGFGQRTTNGTTTTVVEQGYFRIDSIPIVNGLSYPIWSSPIIFESSVAGDTIQVVLRGEVSADGSTVATTASTQLTVLTDDSKSASSSQRTKGLKYKYDAGSNAFLSLLLSYVRVAGTGNVRINASTTIPCQLVMERGRIAPPNTAVNL